MWWSRKARARELEALRRSITDDVLARVGETISLEVVDAAGRPNGHPLNVAVRNVGIANLNLKYFGYDLARRIAADLPPRTDTSEGFVGLAAKPSTQADMESGWVAHWCAKLGTPVVMHRKLWELSYVLQAIFEHGHMRDGARALGFGCGEEPIASYLASRGMAVTVTDLEAEQAQAAGWAATGQHAASLEKAFKPDLVDRATFDRLVAHETADMNAIPTHLRGYDACWSVCAFEHLGSIERGLAFVENSLATLRPGGLAVHTTELNIAPDGPTVDNWPSVLFQRHHFETLAERLRGQGHDVAPLDFDIGDRPMDRFVDLPPWGHDMAAELERWHGDGAHLKVAIDGFVSTCFGLIVRKAG